MNTAIKNGILALLLVFATTVSLSAQIKPSKKKPTTTPTEQTDKPSESENTDSKPSTTAPKKTTAKKTDQYFDESGGFKHRLWYGGNVILNFDGGQNYSLFTIGVTPMVGYKIIGGLSAGPRVGITYTNFKAPSSAPGNEVKSVGLTNYSLGAFTRYKLFKNFFVHGEYEYQSIQYPGNGYNIILVDASGKPIKQRFGLTNYYGGVGYNSGGLVGYEIMLLYNFNIPKNSTASPIDLRFGFTYNF